MKNMITSYLKKIIQTAKYYVVFSKAAPFISFLILVHSWIEYALIAILITHLTDDWLHLPEAASIVNVHGGVTAVLVLVVSYASDAYLGSFITVICTNVAYIIGLVLLFFAAWRLHSIELRLLYVALMFIALGRAGRDVPLKEFLADQFRKEGWSEDEEQVESRRKVWWRSAYILGIIASIFVFTNGSWVVLCKKFAIALAIAFTFFLGGIPFFQYKKPTKCSSLNKVVRVLYAAIMKRHLSVNATLSSENDPPPILHIPMLRWLDKASIVESSTSLEEQERKARLCTVEQIQEVKLLLKMIPLWTTFLVYGLLQATGSTFFYEQVNYMDNPLYQILNSPEVIFLIIKTSTSFVVSHICDSVLFPVFWPVTKKIPRHVMLIRIGIGMAISPLCCVIAWRIEDYRKHQSTNMDILISVFCLVPQFFLLGFMEGLVLDGLEEFFYVQVPKSMKIYGPPFTQFALSIGNFLGLPFIMIFPGLFTDDLDTSKLGEYYAILACVCFVNLIFYCCVANSYVKVEEPPAQELEEQLEQIQDMEELRSGHLPKLI